jgi:hypothetical protein
VNSAQVATASGLIVGALLRGHHGVRCDPDWQAALGDQIVYSSSVAEIISGEKPRI